MYTALDPLENPSYLAVRHLNKGPAARAELRQLAGTQLIARKPFSTTNFARCAASQMTHSKNTYTLTSQPSMPIYTKENISNATKAGKEGTTLVTALDIYNPPGLPPPQSARRKRRSQTVVDLIPTASSSLYPAALPFPLPSHPLPLTLSIHVCVRCVQGSYCSRYNLAQ